MNETITHPVSDWIRSLLPNPTLAFIANGLLAVLVLVAVTMSAAPMLIWLERKVSAHIQARVGPMRVGPHGLLQTTADVLKLLFKEIIVPTGADKFVFFFAPLLPLTASYLVLAVIPFDYNLQAADPDMGIPYVIAVSGLGIFGMLLAGWSSNNKYSLLGSLRSGAQLLSYEISIALILLFIVLLSGTTSLREIVLSQQGTVTDWWILKAPLLGFVSFVLYLISSTAELNRGPFDIAEAEQELTAGFHTEYTGTAFAMFFLAEYINMISAASLATVCFLGGWLAPLTGFTPIDTVLSVIPGWLWFAGKVFFLINVYMFFRWTFPRPRVDQLMALEWKFLLPINMVMLLLGALFLSQGWILP